MAEADERLRHRFAQAFDIERLAGREVGDAGDRLSRTLEVRATPGDKPLLARDRPAAGRTFAADMVENRKGGRACDRPDHLDDGRDDLAGFLDEHARAGVDVLAVDLVLVVERGAGHGGPGNQDRFELRHRGEHAGAADLDGDVVEQGFLLLREELVGGGPARGAGR